MSWDQHIIHTLDKLQSLVVALATRLGPLITPIGPAYLVYAALIRDLQVKPFFAGTMGVAVEVVGIASAHLSLRLREWNLTKTKTEPRAPEELAYILTAVYLVVGVVITVALKMLDQLSGYVPALFFLLALTTYVIVALNTGQTQREVQKAQAKVERRELRQARKGEAQVPVQVQTLVRPASNQRRDKMFAVLDDFYLKHGRLPTRRELAEQMKCSVATAHKWMVQYESRGAV